jgi:hypothetical protein
MMVEKAYSGLFGGVSLSWVADPHWSQLVFWSNYRYWPSGAFSENWNGGYVGISILIFCVASCLPARGRARSKRILAPGLCVLVALLMIFGYRWPLIRDLPGLHAFSAGRYILFLVFSLALLVPEGLNRVHVILGHHRPRHYTIIALLILLVDLGPTTFQQPYLTTNKQQLAFYEGDLELHRRNLEAVPREKSRMEGPCTCQASTRSFRKSRGSS